MKRAPEAPFSILESLDSDRERRPATTRGGRVGIADDELRALQALAVVDLSAGQILVAHGIDEQGDAFVDHAGIAFLRLLVEGEAVLEAGATAAGDEHPQLESRVALLLDELL